MARPTPREQNSFSEAVNAIQRARPTPLSIFSDEVEEPGQQTREVHDIEVLNLIFEPDKEVWRKLHNDSNVDIISENERSSRMSTLTFVKFIRRVPVDEPDPEPDTFEELCEEDDPLLDEMWPG